MKRTPLPLLTALLLAPLCTVCAADAAGPAGPPNIVFATEKRA